MIDETGQYQELIVLPSLAAQTASDGKLVLTKKFLAGLAEYAASWPGKVTALVAVNDKPSTEMDLIEFYPKNCDPGIEIRPQKIEDLERRIQNAAMVFAGLTGEELELAQLCARLAIPLVFNSEYTFETEKRIIDLNSRNPILRARRKLWACQNHKRRLDALKLATVLQCSGTPTYQTYSTLKPNTLLFFDSRVRLTDVISEQELAAKFALKQSAGPLKLVFGGRFIPMKGVLELPKVAAALIREGLEFTLDIVGAGPLQGELQRDIDRLGLRSLVEIRPPMDFSTGWVPFLRDHADLFVCCHPQGDPSSTYPEVLSCGVPIVGYDNPAIRGIIALSDAGLISEPEPHALARTIVTASSAAQLKEFGLRARTFAADHAFEKTFLRRVGHMVEWSRLDDDLKAEWMTNNRQNLA